MSQTRICICFYVTIVSPTQFPLSSLNTNWNQQKIHPVNVVPHRPTQTERDLQWLNMSLQFPDNSTTHSYSLIPNKEEWSYQRKTISNKKSNKTLHH